MEQIRKVTVTLVIDTNKRTIEREFTAEELTETFGDTLARAFWNWVHEMWF